MYGSGTDPLSVYYATPQTEVMYHVVPRLPLEPTTRQQQGRKKIIATDPVLIIWCERSRDYYTDSIMSNIAQVHIVIYPYHRQGVPCDNTNLFRVEICRRSKNRKTMGEELLIICNLIICHYFICYLIICHYFICLSVP
jgi:hypothetical protein